MPEPPRFPDWSNAPRWWSNQGQWPDRYSSGFDLLETSLNLLTTGNYSKPQHKINSSFYRLEFFLCPPGRVFKNKEYNVKDNSVYAKFYYREGDVVKNINNVMEKVGYQIIKE